ncbi:MAG: hypothetical protein AAFX10_05350 [Pseudomonadota bacterium]
MRTDVRNYLVGALAAPLPFVLAAIIVLALTVGLSETLLVFTGIIYALVLLPLAAAHGFASLLERRSLLAYAAAMFLVSFLPVAIGWQFVPFGEDSNLAIEFDDGVERPVPLPLAGVLLALVLALVNTVCMVIFWFIAVRGTGIRREPS